MKSIMDIWWLFMTRVSYWWMRTSLTLTVMKLDVMCLLAHLYFHVVIHSGKVSWGLSGTYRYWRCFMGPKVWFVHYDDKFWSGNTVKGIQAQQGWNYVQIHGWYRYWKKKNVCWRVLLSAALTELDESKLVFSSSGDSGTENELMFSSYLGPPHPLVRGE